MALPSSEAAQGPAQSQAVKAFMAQRYSRLLAGPSPTLLCPITHDVFEDPVLAQDGHTYERGAITEHFRTCRRSPMTNQHIQGTALMPNYALKAAVADYRASLVQGVADILPVVIEAQDFSTAKALLAKVGDMPVDSSALHSMQLQVLPAAAAAGDIEWLSSCLPGLYGVHAEAAMSFIPATTSERVERLHSLMPLGQPIKSRMGLEVLRRKFIDMQRKVDETMSATLPSACKSEAFGASVVVAVQAMTALLAEMERQLEACSAAAPALAPEAWPRPEAAGATAGAVVRAAAGAVAAADIVDIVDDDGAGSDVSAPVDDEFNWQHQQVGEYIVRRSTVLRERAWLRPRRPHSTEPGWMSSAHGRLRFSRPRRNHSTEPPPPYEHEDASVWRGAHSRNHLVRRNPAVRGRAWL